MRAHCFIDTFSLTAFVKRETNVILLEIMGYFDEAIHYILIEIVYMVWKV